MLLNEALESEVREEELAREVAEDSTTHHHSRAHQLGLGSGEPVALGSHLVHSHVGEDAESEAENGANASKGLSTSVNL
eukprot:CAMPEP_0168608366 /NCGR_PEP_ID=MMETSP0449_2-20121227/589_1 /TAXON_ID=1082188 /ORGANISM="Strombidium rassoulzadegani, Strain ras09" /LENGTH=78 /DNA_ID=CAMNT_0008648347 /DNA_START=237 /DNA_END=470 /DNA_ORIENTATION=-